MSLALGGDARVTVVSGLPRSGTSLMMQMLAAAGIPIQQDGVRAADDSNARGYFEWEPIKQLARHPERMAECAGKAVKVISSLLPSLPDGPDYRIIFLERNLVDVAASQARMIERLGTRGGRLAPEQMVRALEMHRTQVYAWLDGRGYRVLKIAFEDLLRGTAVEVEKVIRFVGLGDDAAAAMCGAVAPELRHHGS